MVFSVKFIQFPFETVHFALRYYYINNPHTMGKLHFLRILKPDWFMSVYLQWQMASHNSDPYLRVYLVYLYDAYNHKVNNNLIFGLIHNNVFKYA